MSANPDPSGKWLLKQRERERERERERRVQRNPSEADQALDNLEQFLDDDGDALIAKQLRNDTEVRSSDEAGVQRVDAVVAVAQTLQAHIPLSPLPHSHTHIHTPF